MKAIILHGEPGKASLEMDRRFPKPRPGYVLVDVKAVALNPTDWKHIDYINSKDSLSGCDYAGVVAETGTGYSKQWKVGDRICGFTHGGNQLQTEDGAFAERIAAKADIQMRIPENMSFEEASTLGVGVITCGQGLFQQMGLNLPGNPATGEIVLIYGGSTATGSLGIQFAKLAGYTPITTCSPRNFDFVKSLGAAETFDYSDPDCAEKIRKYADNNLKYIWDTISLDSSAKICAEAIAPGGICGRILGVKVPRDDIKTTFSLGYTAAGEPVKKPFGDMPDNAKDFEFAKKWIETVEPLLQAGKIKVHPPKVGKGLESVLDGLDLMRNDKVSGHKLVYVL
ncbi:zinc-binding oxidoreductase alcohol dehydrogenase [Exophiala viscosa]|uniref:zinc-binding oxidoreductase alcohol dehydrogenase n=1 Tax=Exophiala viscosa TaxID=2486360 RepID=UPI002194FA3F|nr:zinc-binding oxidoreductase alcohol dehydrogenase [Exophiala viscosa]